MRLITLAVLVGVLALGVAGCGGTGRTTPAAGHTYVVVPTAGQTALPTEGFDITLVSPVAIPTDVLRTRGTRLVAQADGPEDCSYTKPVEGLSGELAYLNGKTLTLKVSGSSQIAATWCSGLKRERTFPGILGGRVTPPPYTVGAVRSAFSDHGIKLRRVPLSRVSTGFVLLRADQVSVVLAESPRNLGSSYFETKPGFRYRERGNLVVSYRLDHAKAVLAALAQLDG